MNVRIAWERIKHFFVTGNNSLTFSERKAIRRAWYLDNATWCPDCGHKQVSSHAPPPGARGECSDDAYSYCKNHRRCRCQNQMHFPDWW